MAGELLHQVDDLERRVERLEDAISRIAVTLTNC